MGCFNVLTDKEIEKIEKNNNFTDKQYITVKNKSVLNSFRCKKYNKIFYLNWCIVCGLCTGILNSQPSSNKCQSCCQKERWKNPEFRKKRKETFENRKKLGEKIQKEKELKKSLYNLECQVEDFLIKKYGRPKTKQELNRKNYIWSKNKMWEYLGQYCADCGCRIKGTNIIPNPHHLDRSKKKFNILSECHKYSQKSIIVELEKCILLCGGEYGDQKTWNQSCHAERHIKEFKNEV